MDNIKIGIAAMSKRAGASFVTLLLAGELASKNNRTQTNPESYDGKAIGNLVTVAAANDTYYYDSLGFENRFAKGSFISFEEYDQQTSQDFQERAILPNFSEGINWLVSSPKTAGIRISEREKARTVLRISRGYVLWDMGCISGEKLEEAAKDTDMMIYVIDPLPSEMLPAYDCFEKIRDFDIPVVFVINRMNSGVDKKDLLSFLKIKKPVILPWADPALIYKSEYKCELFYKNDDIRQIMKPSVKKLADIVDDIVKHKRR